MGQEHGVLFLHGGPVRAVHVRIVEVVAVDPPGLIVDLTPLRSRIDPHFHVGDGEPVRGGFDVRPAGIADEPAARGRVQHALAVRRQVVEARAPDHGRLFTVGEREAAKAGAGAGAAEPARHPASDVEELARIAGLQVRVAGFGQRQGEDALIESVEVDVDDHLVRIIGSSPRRFGLVPRLLVPSLLVALPREGGRRALLEDGEIDRVRHLEVVVRLGEPLDDGARVGG